MFYVSFFAMCLCVMSRWWVSPSFSLPILVLYLLFVMWPRCFSFARDNFCMQSYVKEAKKKYNHYLGSKLNDCIVWRILCVIATLWAWDERKVILSKCFYIRWTFSINNVSISILKCINLFYFWIRNMLKMVQFMNVDGVKVVQIAWLHRNSPFFLNNWRFFTFIASIITQYVRVFLRNLFRTAKAPYNFVIIFATNWAIVVRFGSVQNVDVDSFSFNGI